MYGFFWNLLKYKFKNDTGFGLDNIREAAKEIRLEAEMLNPVWQKFCQNLACRNDIIGEILSEELKLLLDKCPIHSHIITQETLNKEMPEEIFETPFSDEYLIGSGTIAQVYRSFNISLKKWVVVKVKHPNIHRQINESFEEYINISKSIIFPKNFISCGENFFKGLYQQDNFEHEFASGQKMRHFLSNSQEQLISGDQNIKYPSVFIVPEMIKYSESIIIMDYEPGDYNLTSIPDNAKIYKYLTDSNKFNPNDAKISNVRDLVGLIMIHIQIVSIMNGLLHSDLHWGNFSIRLNPFSIVLYDFGWTIDLSEISIDFRKDWARAFFERDVVIIFKLIINRLDIPDKEKIYHNDNINDIIKGMELGSNNYLFSDKFKRILLYCQLNSLLHDKTLLSVLYPFMYSEQIEKMIQQTIPPPNEVIEYLPFAEFQCLKELIDPIKDINMLNQPLIRP